MTSGGCATPVISGGRYARRMPRKDSRLADAERAKGRTLRDLAGEAVEIALQLAPDVADASSPAGAERAIDLPFSSVDDAVYARKRVNEALAVAEYGSEVQAWVWRRDRHQRPPLTSFGDRNGWELRLEQLQARA